MTISEKYCVDVVDLDEVALWAIREKKWAPQQAEIRRQCRELLSRALREERITDPQGRRIRKYHAIRQEKNGHTLWLWGDIDTANHNHMKVSFQQRRREVVGDCCLLKTDIDSYNDNYNKNDPINLCFDFTKDIEKAKMFEIESGSSGKKQSRVSSQSLITIQ